MTLEIDPASLRAEAEGLAFPEGPRWHDGALWFSDIAAGRVWRLDAAGALHPVAEGLDRPSGLGWLPDGRLLVVEGTPRRLLRFDPGGAVVHADLSAFAPHPCNDMVVGPDGRAWVGHWGFDFAAGAAPQPASLIAVDPDGRSRVAAGGLMFPNGCAITPDGATLLVGETWASRITAFPIAADGALGARRVWAATGPDTPDGLCLDAEGAAWFASPLRRSVLRVREGGAVTHRLALPEHALAVALGGADRRTLFVLCARLVDGPRGARRFVDRAESVALASGRVFSLRVDVAGAGWP